MTITMSKLKTLKKVKATRITHGLDPDAIQSWIEERLDFLKQQGADPKIEDSSIVCNNGQWVRIPPLFKKEECEIEFKSIDFLCFINNKIVSRGTLPKKEDMTEDGFRVKDYYTYIIHI